MATVLKVFGDSVDDNLFFRMSKEGPDIIIHIVDEEGNFIPEGIILRIHDTTSGIMITRLQNVSKHMGFYLDDAGRIYCK